ncbi:calcium-binding protein [Dapis sp. BLCC M126]|uniref:calcium-binding protein n=1 Tax=Dapis sp. BLCC M126 TaxID=3400189 RepID=UPI003CEAC117
MVSSRFADSFLDGLGGDDRMFGGFGRDVLFGGTGEDFIDGGSNDDVMFGQDGDDLLFAKNGDDYVEGGNGDDLIDGSLGNDQLDGGAGNDQLNGGIGSDVLLGGTGSDNLVGGSNSGIGNFPLEQDILIGGTLDSNGNPVGDGVSDTFVLGDSAGSFYTKSGFGNIFQEIFAGGDYALILGFEKGIDQLEFSPVVPPENFILGTASIFTPVDTLIIEGNELIAVFAGVDLTV